MTTPDQIDAILPQTQCGLCSYKGCRPYAEALAKNEAPINLCPPGGVQGLVSLAELLNQDPTPYIPEMEQKAKPNLRAVIREAECIGCTKCIQACPVDAILGAAKLMHTVIQDECTGCELCIAPCPVDCIDIIEIPANVEDKRDQYRGRYLARENRLNAEKKLREEAKIQVDRKRYVIEAVMRAKLKKT